MFVQILAVFFQIGAGEQINYVPMKGSLNQGAWKSMEAGWQSALKSGKKVEVDIKIICGTNKRPIKFEVEWKIDGNIDSDEFIN